MQKKVSNGKSNDKFSSLSACTWLFHCPHGSTIKLNNSKDFQIQLIKRIK